jgi:hypothetical protein
MFVEGDYMMRRQFRCSFIFLLLAALCSDIVDYILEYVNYVDIFLETYGLVIFTGSKKMLYEEKISFRETICVEQ